MRKARKPSPARLARIGLRAAGLAHDLAQPLTVALLTAQQIDGPGTFRLRAALHRMHELLQGLRAELRGQRPGRETVDLADLQRRLLGSLAPGDRRRTHIRLEGVAKLDAEATQRILANLILNALRHGRGKVAVKGKARRAKLSVTVSGGAGRTPSTPGWGIGLASCQELAGRHGLSLSISISPKGSVATLACRT